MSRHLGGARYDGGSMTLELAILTPAVLALLALVIVAGRVVVAGTAVEQASAAAARAASQARSAEAAQQAATQTVHDELAGQGLHCANSRSPSTQAGSRAPWARRRRSRPALRAPCSLAI